MENPSKLFEKFTHDVSRQTQKEEWEKLSNSIVDNGIFVKDVATLRQNINNWTRRAMVSKSNIKHFY